MEKDNTYIKKNKCIKKSLENMVVYSTVSSFLGKDHTMIFFLSWFNLF